MRSLLPRHRPSHAVVIAYLALFVAATGTATAATGGSFILGKTNVASRATTLVNSGKGVALRLKAPAHTAPLSVSGNTTKVPGLNADLLDGLSSNRLQRKVSSNCGRGGTVATIHVSGYAICGPTVLWAVVKANGTLARGTKGTVAKPITTGTYQVDFGVDIRNCSYVGSVGDPSTAAAGLGFVTTATRLKNPQAVFVETWNTSFKASSQPFHLVVACTPKH
jgi:hypothetical protein